MPTSITAAPGLIQSPRTNSGLPMAATTISAPADHLGDIRGAAVADGDGGVAVVEQRCYRDTHDVATAKHDGGAARNLHARLSSRTMQPAGVQGTKSGSRPFITSRPMLTGWKPSTSLFEV